MIELSGSAATVESHFLAYERVRSARRGTSDVHVGGRYLDRFEKRAGEWRIIHRDVVFCWFSPLPASDWSQGLFGKQVPFSAKYPGDWLCARLGVQAGARGCH
ncbi:MAG: nuclear transport factor 2 family protein [Gammaproteobacteria bacterium]